MTLVQLITKNNMFQYKYSIKVTFFAHYVVLTFTVNTSVVPTTDLYVPVADTVVLEKGNVA